MHTLHMSRLPPNPSSPCRQQSLQKLTAQITASPQQPAQKLSFAFLTLPNTSQSGVSASAFTASLMPASEGRRKGLVSSSSPNVLGTVASPCSSSSSTSKIRIITPHKYLAAALQLLKVVGNAACKACAGGCAHIRATNCSVSSCRSGGRTSHTNVHYDNGMTQGWATWLSESPAGSTTTPQS